MDEIPTQIKQLQEQIENALWSFEMAGENSQALAVYQDVETQLEALAISPGDPDYAEYQRVLADCLMREGNLLRQLGQPQEAMALGERELVAARACGDPITTARSLMSNGSNHILAGRVETAMGSLEEARSLFERGNSHDHRQGLGWYWILHADLINAGLIAGGPPEVIEAADRALAILLPIENWPGIARAYQARAVARERSGNLTAASADRQPARIFGALMFELSGLFGRDALQRIKRQ